MTLLEPTLLADASARAVSRRSWGTTVVGIGIGAVIIAAIAGWIVPIVVIGVLLAIVGFVMMFSAEMLIRNALTEAVVDSATGYDVTFDQSWWPKITTIYRESRAESAKTGVLLDAVFEVRFRRLLGSEGYTRSF